MLETIERLEARLGRLEAENRQLATENRRLAAENRRLATENRRLAAENRRLAGRLARIERERNDLRAERDADRQAERASQRQATPFSKPEHKRKPNPKRPGRKPGQGIFTHRLAPEPTEPAISVRVTRSRCPGCGGRLRHARTERVSITELPALPRPTVTPYDVEVCDCPACGTKVRGAHPDLAQDQRGASAHRYGPRVHAACHLLHYGIGIPVRKVPEVLQLLTGLEITQGAITQNALRQMRGPVGQAYQALRARVQHSDFVHTDDTGWTVASEAAQLMVFETTGSDPVTVFQIRAQHRNEEVRELIPADYAGTMTTDRGPAYDAEALQGVKQNKCLAHLKRNIKAAMAGQPPGARSFGSQLLLVLDAALDLWHDYRADRVSLRTYRRRAGPLLAELTYLLRDRVLTDPDNQRLLDGLGWHDDRDNLLRFLRDPEIEPTNNRAERALRPAVIARKVSQSSKNQAGAEAHAGFLSVIRTLARRTATRLNRTLGRQSTTRPTRRTAQPTRTGTTLLDQLTTLIKGHPLPTLQPTR